MKKFVLNVLSLLIPLLLCGFIFYQINTRLFDSVKHRVPDKVNTVMVGASVSKNAINDSLIDYLDNYSIAGRPSMDFYLVSKRLKRDNPHIKNIMTDFSVQATSVYRDYMFAIPSMSHKTLNRIYPLASHERFNTYPINKKSYWKMLIRQKYTPNTDFIKAWINTKWDIFDVDIPYIGAYEYREGNDLDESLLDYGIKRYFYRKGEEMPVSEIDIGYFDSLVVWSAKEDLNLIIFCAPMHPSAKSKTPKKFIDLYAQKLEHFRQFPHVKILEYTSFRLPDSCYANHNHLNHFGADLLTAELADTLPSIIKY